MLWRDLLMVAAQTGDGPSYSAEATALFARMSVAPDATRKGHIDTLIRALKTAGSWAKMDALYMEAAHDAQAARLNWVSSSYDALAVNSPTFETDRGYTGDGATSYLDFQFNAATAGGKYAQNDAHMGLWTDTSASTATQIDIGHTSARICSRSGTSISALRSNVASTDNLSITATTGWTCWSRQASATYEAARNLEAHATITRSSTGVASLPFYGLAIAGSGPAAANFSTRRQQIVHFGSGLNDNERDATYSALLTYMQAVGAA